MSYTGPSPKECLIVRVIPGSSLLAFAVLCLQPACSQTSRPHPITAPATAQAPCTCTILMAQRHLPPYTATQTITHTQTLANGTTIRNTDVVLLARDADGRTRSDTTRTLPDGTQSHFIYVYDPVVNTRMSWNVNNPSTPKVVTVYSLQTTSPAPTVAATARRYYPTTSQSLPPTTIQDLYAEGYRTTRTVSAGYQGNDHDLTTTTEYWNAPTLGLMLRRIVDDPIAGKTDTETTDIEQVAADPSLFQPPVGYQIKNVTQ